MSKRHSVFTGNFTGIFFSNAGKTGNVREFKFEKIFGVRLLEIM